MSKVPVPILTFCPRIIFSVAPLNYSMVPKNAASNKISAVFSNEANMRGEDFILAIPYRFRPMSFPLKVMVSASRYKCLISIYMP